jgi:hypothetical protein
MLSRHRMEAPQAGQWDRGVSKDRSGGMRLMQTFRKLPNASPRMNSTHSKIRSNVFCRSPLLRSMEAQQISTQRHFASLIGRTFLLPIDQLAIHPTHLGLGASPAIAALFADGNLITCYVITGLTPVTCAKSVTRAASALHFGRSCSAALRSMG